eukprot:5368588-Amphidinium_carterae.1
MALDVTSCYLFGLLLCALQLSMQRGFRKPWGKVVRWWSTNIASRQGTKARRSSSKLRLFQIGALGFSGFVGVVHHTCNTPG